MTHADVNGKIPCNKKARWNKTTDLKSVVCKKCRKSLGKGIQIVLNLGV